ncbi:MAG: hypothetical protein QW035_01860 [Candidatus Anstonellales archaeon]
MADIQTIATFPFCREAKIFIEQLKPEVNEYNLELGLRRIEKAIKGKPAQKVFFDEKYAEEEIISYAFSRLILAYAQNHYLLSRCAIFEAKQARRNMTMQSIPYLSAEFGIQGHELKVTSYLMFAPSTPHYMLLNRELSKGVVKINHEEHERLIEEAITRRLLSIEKPAEPNKLAQKYASMAISLIPSSPSKIKPSAGMPPCIKRMIEDALAHRNLSHTERWVLAAYLIRNGYSNSEISSIFSNLPDYNEKITSYHLEHIRKKGYSVPSCDKLKMYGICTEDCKKGYFRGKAK